MDIFVETRGLGDDYFKLSPSGKTGIPAYAVETKLLSPGDDRAFLYRKQGRVSLLLLTRTPRSDLAGRPISNILSCESEYNVEIHSILAPIFEHCLECDAWNANANDKLNASIEQLVVGEDCVSREHLPDDAVRTFRMEWENAMACEPPIPPIRYNRIYPRNNFQLRKQLAKALPGLLQGQDDFLFGLLDSKSEEAVKAVCEVLGFDTTHCSHIIFFQPGDEERRLHLPKQDVMTLGGGLVSKMKSFLQLNEGDSTSLEQRFFALCERVCKPLSFLSLLMIPGWALLRHCGVDVPPWVTGYLHPIFVSAAIGYLTNWVAIEMLFKPYERTWCHPFAWLTLGYWRQGLIPKNKSRIAKTLAEQVSGQLLQPEKLAQDLCDMVGNLLENKEMISQFQAMLKQQVLSHKQEIVTYLGPKIETGIITELDKLLTAENVQKFWDTQIEPRLSSEEFRSRLTAIIIDAIDKKTPVIAEKIRPALVQLITDYCQEKIDGLGAFGGFLKSPLNNLAEGLADRMLSAQTIENGITNWLNNPDTPATLSEGLSGMVTTIRDYVKSPANGSELSQFIQGLRRQFKTYLDQWLQENLPVAADAILGSDSLWGWGANMVTESKPQLEKFIQERGMPLILEKLDIENRIQNAVDRQDMRQFHQMLNTVVAQHLGAIQVLGFFLGAIAGALMTVIE